MPGARGGFRRGGRTVDYKAWLGLPGVITSFSTAGTGLGSGTLNFTSPGTILRCHTPDLLALMDSSKQVGDVIRLTLGLGIFSTDAAAATAFPDPADEPEYPWLMWDDISLRSEATSAGGYAIGSTVVRRRYDVKAMRRFKPGQTLAWVLQRGNVSGAPTTHFLMAQTRVLIGT